MQPEGGGAAWHLCVQSARPGSPAVSQPGGSMGDAGWVGEMIRGAECPEAGLPVNAAVKGRPGARTVRRVAVPVRFLTMATCVSCAAQPSSQGPRACGASSLALGWKRQPQVC